MPPPEIAGRPSTVASAEQSRRLPPLLLKDAADRVAWLGLIIAILIVIVQLIQRFAQPELAARVLDSPVNRLAALASVLFGVGVFALHRYRVVSATAMLRFGIAIELIVATTISMVETTLPLHPGEARVGMSALGPWIVLVSVFIPQRPAVTLLSALTAATIWPVAYALNTARMEFTAAMWGPVIVWPVFTYLMTFVAYLISRRIYGVSVAAQQAMDLGSYRLVARIGEGGMGEVWRAHHRMLARAAAVKIIRTTEGPGSSARDAELAVRRFEREANVIAALQSPNTVYLYDFGVAQDGRFYYVMELLDGISLQTLVTTFGPQPASRVTEILRQACRSLEEAHQQGIVHRDLKPSNMMLCKVGLTFDFLKVLDFGLAKSIRRQDVSLLTMEGVTAGTPGYIAPEVALGDARADGRADLYALGCVAYFLLTGTLVFEDPNPTSMALKHVQETPKPPSQRTEMTIPAGLEAIVLRCLAKKPDERPPTAAELARALAALDVPSWTEDSAAEWWERHLPPTSSLRSFAQPGQVTPPVLRKA
jgi:eukaryotic-like serine/threonine-protein kinase